MKVLKVFSKNFKTAIKEAVESIREGETIIYPTDTVYGLLADAANKGAVERIFKIKKRPKNKALPIFVKDLKMAKELVEIDKEQEKFLEKVWPGKVTVVLRQKTKNAKLKIYGVDKKTIALRIPNYKLVLGLLKKINRPLTGTSANVSSETASGDIKKVLKQFKSQELQPDLIIDAGNLPKSKPSTVIDLTVSPTKILRN